jgi:hypothetical protein
VEKRVCGALVVIVQRRVVGCGFELIEEKRRSVISLIPITDV